MSTKVRKTVAVVTHTHTHTHTHTQVISRNNLGVVDTPKNNINSNQKIQEVSLYQTI